MLTLTIPLLLLWALLWAFLNWREKRRAGAGLPRHSGPRLIFAAIAALTVLFSGGCSLVFLSSWIANGTRANDYVTWEAIAILGGPPLVIGILVWWLAMRRKSG
jgi:hypothetical protein